jgi:WD40 repeat protein
MWTMRVTFVLLALALVAAFVTRADNRPPPRAASGPLLRAKLEARFSDGEAPGQQLLFSPDGALLATASAGGTVTLRRVVDGTVVHRLDHRGGATAVAFEPAGEWVVSGGYDGVLRMWDMQSGRLIRELEGHSGTAWSIDVSPDGERIASGGEDRTVRVWRAADGNLLRRFAGHALNIWEVRFSPDGGRVASASFDRTVRIWDVATGAVVRTLTGHKQAVVGLAYSPDGKFIATGSDDSTVRLWRTADGALLRTLANGNHAYKVAYSGDGRWLVSGGRARGAIGTLWHNVTGLGGEKEAIRLWRFSDGALVGAIALRGDVSSVAVSRDGRWLAAATDGSGIMLWRLGQIMPRAGQARAED